MEEKAQTNRPGLFELFLLFLRVGPVASGGRAYGNHKKNDMIIPGLDLEP
jgi:hypothetical protein